MVTQRYLEKFYHRVIVIDIQHLQIDTARVYASGSSEEYLGKIDLAAKGLKLETKLYPAKVRKTVYNRQHCRLTYDAFHRVLLNQSHTMKRYDNSVTPVFALVFDSCIYFRASGSIWLHL